MRKTKLICNYEGCKATFLRADRYQYHINQHFNVRPYVCLYQNCNKSYTSAQHLQRHEEIHKGTYACTMKNCDMLFKTKSTLRKHISIIHSKTKPKTYKCSHCDEQFNCISWLKKHEYREHTGVKPYGCTYDGCDKKFLTPSKLRRHLIIHDGYKCNKPGCNEIIPKWNLYLKHLKDAHPAVHTCDICQRQLSSFANLKAHIATHYLEDREVFECTKPHCSRFYFKKSNLTQHIKSYHEKRPFMCQQENCNREYKSEVDLTKHMLRQHRSSLPPEKKIKKEEARPKRKLTECSPLKKSKRIKSNMYNISEEENQHEQDQKSITSDEEHTVIVKSQSMDNDTKSSESTNRKLEYVTVEEFIKV